MDRAVKSGDARRIGASALDSVCNEFRAQTRFAAHELFSSVSISVDASGAFTVSGSLGDKWRQFSVGFEYPNTIVATGSMTVDKPVPLAAVGGEVKFSGTLAGTIKCMARDPVSPDQASVIAHIVVLIALGVVLRPAAAWLIGSATAPLARAAVRQAAGGLAKEYVILGASPRP
jgi:hypothetical protein